MKAVKNVAAKKGDMVSVHYTGKLDDGAQFDTSIGEQPIEFCIGYGQVIPGFENAVIGLKPGESTTVRIPVEQAYGHRDERMILQAERTDFPDDLEPKLGQALQLQMDNGAMQTATVVEIDGSKITLDANHPLAGKCLTFELKLIEII